MKKMLLFVLGLGAVVLIMYFALGKFSSKTITSLGQAVESNKSAALAGGQVLGAETIKGVLGGVNNLIAQTETTVKNAVANLVKSAGQSATDKITGAILGNSSSPQNNTLPPSGSGVSICPVYSKNQTVSYDLKFQSASANQAYSVDWGDGKASEGNTSEIKVSLSHTYSNSGSYTVTFKTGSFTSQKDICVQ